MAHYVMSDIHGEMDRFDAMLEKIRFTEADELYILGDVVDRGPRGVTLLRRIMKEENVHMLLGNHEHMLLSYFSPYATETDYRRWNRNGNGPTLDELVMLHKRTMQELLRYLQDLPIHIELNVDGRDFYLVHGFPGNTLHDEVWGRPAFDTPNPLPGKQVIVGHTPVLNLIPEEKREDYARELIRNQDHLRIMHCPGFIDLDCGCGHRINFRALSCLRLEDMEEFYT